MTDRQLTKRIGTAQAVGLYVTAVVGAGVLVLPGNAAAIAGPASIVSWAIDALLGIPLALTFAALASKLPDAGGLASFASRAFSPSVGAVVGWFYFFASCTAQIIVPLTGAYYAASYFDLGASGTFVLAALILAGGVFANLRGMRISGKIALLLSAGIIIILSVSTAGALPHIDIENFRPFMPNGWSSVGNACIFLFFAFFGWEAIAQLSEEFVNPRRDIPRATLWSVLVISVLYIGVAFATVGTHAYGDVDTNRTSVAVLVHLTFGDVGELILALVAIIISLGTANAFIAATSRLGYALARDGSFPAWIGQLDDNGTPWLAILTVGIYGGVGLFLSYILEWSAKELLAIPNSLALCAYTIGLLAGARLLTGRMRACSLFGAACCLVIVLFGGMVLVLPAVIACSAVLYRNVLMPKLRKSQSVCSRN